MKQFHLRLESVGEHGAWRSKSVSFIVLALTVFSSLLAVAEDCGPLPKPPVRTPDVEITLVRTFTHPVLDIRSRGAQGILGGFEGGSVVRANNLLHLFTTEMLPTWNSGLAFDRTRLADWASKDGIHWHRVGTIFNSTGDRTGKDPRAALWAPMPIYDRANGVWDLFYVAYRSKPNEPPAWYDNYDGELVRAVSQVKGPSGIDGPYRDADVIMRPGPASDKWEGLQGDDSVFPYRADGRWFTFYGSANTGKGPGGWRVGLASAPELSGPWERCSSLNPSPLGQFIENPIVRKIDGEYVAVYDDLNPRQEHSIGYVASLDGVHWGPAKQLVLFSQSETHPRTPLGLVPNADGTFDLYVTALSTIARRGGGKGGIAEAVYLFKVAVSIGPRTPAK